MASIVGGRSSAYLVPGHIDFNARRLREEHANFEEAIHNATSTEELELIVQKINAETTDLQKNANLNPNEEKCWGIIIQKLNKQLTEKHTQLIEIQSKTSDSVEAVAH